MNKKGRATEVAPFTRSEVCVCFCVWTGLHTYRNTHSSTHADKCCVWYWLYGEQLCVAANCRMLRPYHRIQHLKQRHRQTHRGQLQGATEGPQSQLHPPTQNLLSLVWYNAFQLITKWPCFCYTSQNRSNIVQPYICNCLSPTTCQRQHLNPNRCPKCLPTPLPNPCTSHKPQHHNPVPPPILAVSRQLSPLWSLEAIRDLREKPFIQGLSQQAGTSKCLMSAKHHKCCKWHLFCLSKVANKLF